MLCAITRSEEGLPQISIIAVCDITNAQGPDGGMINFMSATVGEWGGNRLENSSITNWLPGPDSIPVSNSRNFVSKVPRCFHSSDGTVRPSIQRSLGHLSAAPLGIRVGYERHSES